MKQKTEIESLDQLLERREQTDIALAEIADSLREKLRKLESAMERRQIKGNKPQNAAGAFEWKLGGLLWTWCWRIIAFITMSAAIWTAMALLKT
jgi:hypothetical protein